MIIDTRQSVVISSLGWVDGGSLWVFKTRDETVTSITLSEAKYLSLHEGRNDHFAVVHHYDDDRVEVSAHIFANPGRAVARAEVSHQEQHFLGDSQTWVNLPRSYVAYYQGPRWSDFILVRLDPGEGRVDLQRFDWYNDDYDKGSQGIVGVTEVPATDHLIVSVQRNSRPVLYDPSTRAKLGQIELAGRQGNPRLYFRRTARELWADDYDTLVKLDPSTWKILGKRRLQDAASGTQQFIGAFSFDPAEQLCLVARPFSGDVIALNPRNLRTLYRCNTGGQRLEAVTISTRGVVARDWKTGALLTGHLRRAWLV
jgi:hypothetical protein